MRPTAACASAFSVFVLLFMPRPAISADSELDQYEEKSIARSAERAFRLARADRAVWMKELESVYQDRVGNPLTEDEYGMWFVLLAGKGEEWRKNTSASAGIGELFDRVVQRLELGPVPSLKREEFMKYAKKVLIPSNPPAAGAAVPDPNEDADKVFRALDRDGDGILNKEEVTSKLRDERLTVDSDGNGRIDKNEYRVYFQKRVTLGVDMIAAAKATERGRGPDGKPVAAAKSGLPDWWAALDTDKDTQIALHEWRKAGRPITLFMAMDLDEDGLLTRDEFARYMKMNEKKDMASQPDGGNPQKSDCGALFNPLKHREPRALPPGALAFGP